jgi:phage shock protein A
MSLFDRVSRLVRANVNDAIDKAEDPEKILDQALRDFQAEFIKLKEAAATAIAAQKRTQAQLESKTREAQVWQDRAKLALEKGDEELARQALVRKKSEADAAAALQAQQDQQNVLVDGLKKNLMMMESKIAEAKTKKDMLKVRAKTAKANEQLQSAVNTMNADSAMAAFERMENKVLELEARSQTAAELAGANLEVKFLDMAGDAAVENELAQMKGAMGLLGGAPASPQSLPSGAGAAAPEATASSAVDKDLEALKQQIDGLS